MLPALQWYFGSFRLHAASCCLWRDGELTSLSPKPIALLSYLVTHAGEVVTKAALLDAVWPDTAVSEGVLKTYIGQIRQVLGGSARSPQFIETVPRRGYRFIAPVTTIASVEIPVAQLPPIPSQRLVSLTQEGDAPALRLVGREAELAQLRAHFARTCQGERQVVVITGEAGIGKTTLVDAFVTQMESTADVWIGRGQCVLNNTAQVSRI